MNEVDQKKKATRIVEAACELKAERPIVLDVRKLTSYTDTFVILGGRSDRQVRAIADAIVQALKQDNDQPLGVEGLDDGNWVLIDCNDVIVHVFDPETRERYDLERLWRDAPRLELGIEPDPSRPSELGDDTTEAAGSAA
ncbi:MAG: ribosome silencing factor [Myxococcota bacterium]